MADQGRGRPGSSTRPRAVTGRTPVRATGSRAVMSAGSRREDPAPSLARAARAARGARGRWLAGRCARPPPLAAAREGVESRPRACHGRRVRAVVQRVSRAEVRVEGRVAGAIGRGLLVLLGVGREDGESDARLLADKVAALRIFEDAEGKMNLAAAEVGGAVLVVSQFTLLGDARKGNRLSFIDAAPLGGGPAVRRVLRDAAREEAPRRDRRVPGPHGRGAGERRPGHDPARLPPALLSRSRR